MCYDHLAGELGVLVYDGLIRNGVFMFGERGIELSSSGHRFFRSSASTLPD